jgi:nucleotide-binding universal stress UspA family protein
MRRLLIPFDGSAAAMRAVQYVVKLAGAMTEPLDVVLLAVVPPAGFAEQLLQGKPSEVRALLEPELEDARKSLQPAAAAFAKAGVTSQQHVEIGAPEELITQYGKTYHCNMIVMGTRGLGSAGLLLGSVANKTVHLTELPVMLVK